MIPQLQKPPADDRREVSFLLAQDGVLGIGVFHIMLLCCFQQGQLALVGGEASAQMLIVQQSLLNALLCDGNGVGQSGGGLK